MNGFDDLRQWKVVVGKGVRKKPGIDAEPDDLYIRMVFTFSGELQHPP
jgi:hypothetical protein